MGRNRQSAFVRRAADIVGRRASRSRHPARGWRDRVAPVARFTRRSAGWGCGPGSGGFDDDCAVVGDRDDDVHVVGVVDDRQQFDYRGTERGLV